MENLVEDFLQYLRNEQNPVAVPVEVVGETESTSSIRPRKKQELQARDQIAVKGAIFVYNTLKAAADKIQ